MKNYDHVIKNKILPGGKLTKNVSAKKLWKTNLKDVDIIENRCILASQE